MWCVSFFIIIIIPFIVVCARWLLLVRMSIFLFVYVLIVAVMHIYFLMEFDDSLTTFLDLCLCGLVFLFSIYLWLKFEFRLMVIVFLLFFTLVLLLTLLRSVLRKMASSRQKSWKSACVIIDSDDRSSYHLK